MPYLVEVGVFTFEACDSGDAVRPLDLDSGGGKSLAVYPPFLVLTAVLGGQTLSTPSVLCWGCTGISLSFFVLGVDYLVSLTICRSIIAPY